MNFNIVLRNINDKALSQYISIACFRIIGEEFKEAIIMEDNIIKERLIKRIDVGIRYNISVYWGRAWGGKLLRLLNIANLLSVVISEYIWWIIYDYLSFFEKDVTKCYFFFNILYLVVSCVQDILWILRCDRCFDSICRNYLRSNMFAQNHKTWLQVLRFGVLAWHNFAVCTDYLHLHWHTCTQARCRDHGGIRYGLWRQCGEAFTVQNILSYFTVYLSRLVSRSTATWVGIGPAERKREGKDGER